MPLIRTSKTIFIGKSCVHITVQLFELHVSSDGLYQCALPPSFFHNKECNKVTRKIKDIAFLITMCLFSVRDINVCVNLCHTKKYYIEKYASYTMMIRTFYQSIEAIVLCSEKLMINCYYYSLLSLMVLLKKINYGIQS